MFLIAIGASEVFLRLLGYMPFNPLYYETIITPQGMFIQDSLLGYTLSSGIFTIKSKSKLHFACTINEKHHRTTGDANATTKNKIFIYGDSYFFGWGLSDTATFPWKLQSKLKNFKVVNYSVPGHSSLCSYLKLNNDVVADKPSIAIFFYSSYDLDRIVFDRYTQRNIQANRKIMAGLSYPYLSFNYDEFNLRYATLCRRKFSFSSVSAVWNYAEEIYMKFDKMRYKTEEAANWVFNNILTTCSANDVEPIIIFLTDDAMTKLAYRKYTGLGVTCLWAAYDLKNPSYSLLPLDGHPNGFTNSLYTDSVAAIIQKIQTN